MSAMKKNDKIKEVVKQKYGDIVLLNQKSSCCSSSCCSVDGHSIMSEDYRAFDGYIAEADMGLGCGIPTQFANIQKGDIVLDLGSGAGNDCFIARAEVGESGKVIGVDFTPAMVAKARENAKKRGFQNVEFREGDIENLPVESSSIDLVISNCVLNLLPAKDKIFHEIYRVLKPGGHFCISDIVLKGELPRELSKAVEMYVGCVAGAIPQENYLAEISMAKFNEIEVVSRKKVNMPDELLLKYMHRDSLTAFKSGESGIFSITVKAKKNKQMNKRILILCTGNSCRSQMAHGFLQSFDPDLDVHSAGTNASGKLNPEAVEVMKEAGIDISHHTSDSVDKYLDGEWDYVITVCGGANESCPAFMGKVKHRLHIGFDDPSDATGTPEFILSEYIRVRDEIKEEFHAFYVNHIRQ